MEVSARLDQGRPTISVKDYGPGIAPEQQEHLFERFERVDADPTISGLGLGLYITLQIVKAHQGEISLKSALGQGAEFVIGLKS